MGENGGAVRSLKAHLNAHSYTQQGYGYKMRARVQNLAADLDETNKDRKAFVGWSPGAWSVRLAICGEILGYLAKSTSAETLQANERFLEVSANVTLGWLQRCRDALVASVKDYRQRGQQVPTGDIAERIEKTKKRVREWQAARARLFPAVHGD